MEQRSERSQEDLRKYLAHAQQNNPMLTYNLKNKGIVLANGAEASRALKAIQSSPVCPKCEKPAYRDSRETSVCMACGWRGRTITIDEYINQKYHRR